MSTFIARSNLRNSYSIHTSKWQRFSIYRYD